MSKKKEKAKSNLAKRNKEALIKAKEQINSTNVESIEKPTTPEASVLDDTKLSPYEKILAINKDKENFKVLEVREFVDGHNVHQISFAYISKDGKTEGSISLPKHYLKEGDGITITIPYVEPSKEEPSKKEDKSSSKKESTKPEVKQQLKKEDNKSKITKKESKEKIIIPEVIDKEDTIKKEPIKSVAQGLSIIANRERIDENHQVEFLGLMHKAYIDNPNSDISDEHKAAMKEVFDTGICQLTLIYAAQLEEEGKAMLKGVNITKEICPLARKQFLEMYGVTTKELPIADGQMQIQFEEIPKETEVAAKADAKASTINTEEIPEPTEQMTEEEKMDVIRGILKRSNASSGKAPSGSRIGLNFYDSMIYAQKAFNAPKKLAASVALLSEKFNTGEGNLCMQALRNKVFGSTKVNNTPIVAHMLLTQDLKGLGLSDKEVSDIVRVLISSAIEVNCPDDTVRSATFNELNSLLAKIANKEVISGILNKETIEVATSYGKFSINGGKVYSMMANIYMADSPEIISQKLTEISKYYVAPIVRLANYKDESAYSK